MLINIDRFMQKYNRIFILNLYKEKESQESSERRYRVY